ncbi:hypothetical protein GCM10011405_20020 [Rufibacter glacialis]|nr:hypothetical protein GCM10011405_20020 [Rufibacter glacialis]
MQGVLDIIDAVAYIEPLLVHLVFLYVLGKLEASLQSRCVTLCFAVSLHQSAVHEVFYLLNE